VKLFAPLVYSLLHDVKARLESAPRGGLMILTNNRSGMSLITDYLQSKMNVKFMQITGTRKHPRIVTRQENEDRVSVTEKALGEGRTVSTETKTAWNGSQEYNIFIIDTNVVKEGLDVKRVSHIFCNAHFETYSDMVQTYGRADRRCAPNSLNNYTRTLQKTQYTLAEDLNDPHSTVAKEVFDRHFESYRKAGEREKKLKEYSIQ
jgi:ERCC4-related helicase